MEERRLHSKILETSQSKIRRLTDAYTDGVLELADYKVRRELVQAETEAAHERLAVLDEPPPQPPAQAELSAIADCWGSDCVEERRRTVQALLLKVTVHADKSVRLYPRWSSEATVTFTARGQVPQTAGRRGLTGPARKVMRTSQHLAALQIRRSPT